MSYTTIIFLLYLGLATVVYFVIPKKLQWAVLLTASVFFYVVSCGSKTILLFLATGVIYTGALLLEKKRDKQKAKKIIVFCTVLVLVFMLLSTKYFNFFGDLFNHTFGALNHNLTVPTLNIMLPLGISYYTLMAISYIVDVYRQTSSAEKNPLMLLLYLCYFPHIVEGPFDRYNNLMKQFRTPVYWNQKRIRCGGIRAIWGGFKILVVANRAGIIVNAIFSDASSFGGAAALFAAIMYTVQIYAEFSGCMDMVCGISQIFGVSIAENFRRPFFATSITEFWKRWHITLGEWLKDYVFYSVSLSGHFRAFHHKIRTCIKNKHLVTFLPVAYSLFFVWFLNGMWHGASIKFICYGLYYYVLMMFGLIFRPISDKILIKLNISRGSKWWHCFEVIRTCIIVCFGMLLFRAKNLTQAGIMFISIFTDFRFGDFISGVMSFQNIVAADYLLLLISVLLIFAVSLYQEKGYSIIDAIETRRTPLRWSLYLIMMYSIIILGVYGGDAANTSFIYGEF